MPSVVFISRQLAPESVFHKTLTNNGLKVYGQSLIDFSPVPFELPETVDWLFFYSQNGARFFYKNKMDDILPAVKIAAIGPATAAVVKGLEHPVHFIGDGNSETTAEAFLKVAAGQRVVFPRAENSRRSIQKKLDGKIMGIDLVVYQNLPKADIDLPDCDVLVFTSPLNAQAYFSKKKRRENQRVIAIGRTTEAALRKLEITGVEVAEEASEKGLTKAVLAR